MKGITAKDLTYMYDENQYMLVNTTMPKSTLNKKYIASAFHFAQNMNGRMLT